MMSETRFVKLTTGSFQGAWTTHDTIQLHGLRWLIWVGRHAKRHPTYHRASNNRLAIRGTYSLDGIVRLAESFL